MTRKHILGYCTSPGRQWPGDCGTDGRAPGVWSLIRRTLTAHRSDTNYPELTHSTSGRDAMVHQTGAANAREWTGQWLSHHPVTAREQAPAHALRTRSCLPGPETPHPEGSPGLDEVW